MCVFRISVADAIIIFEPRSSFFLICESSFCLFLLLFFACLGFCGIVNTEGGGGKATLVGLTFPLSPPLSSLCRGRGGVGKQGRGITRQRKMIGVSKEGGKRTISYTRARFRNIFSLSMAFSIAIFSLSPSVWHLGAKRASSSFSFQGKRVCKLFLTPIITFPIPLPPPLLTLSISIRISRGNLTPRRKRKIRSEKEAAAAREAHLENPLSARK